MKISRLKIKNFRGIRLAEIKFPDHAVLVGDNNSGKSTILEAIDLVMGPDRASRYPCIDEHDFYAGDYLGDPQPKIEIEVVVTSLVEEQLRHFRDNIEWWDKNTGAIIEGPPAERVDVPEILPALRLSFVGQYDAEEDNFEGQTFYCSPSRDDSTLSKFHRTDKRKCGFLFLRTLRTGRRALSLERGSLLDIILSLKGLRPKMWENVLNKMKEVAVADGEEVGISETLEGIQNSIRSYVPSEWGGNPHMKVSDMTRETLRKVLTIFLNTGARNGAGEEHSAPFYHQGTGTVNMLVLAMLSMIGELKQNVIFAMEEPEIAIPPHTQKRIVSSVRQKSSQGIFTSHSPYVLEEFKPEQILVLKNNGGIISMVPAAFANSIKPKFYKTEFRKRYCEALLARRILIAEGRTEYDALTAVGRHMNELSPENFISLEALGVAIFDAETDSQIAPLGRLFKNLGKEVYTFCDRQEVRQKALIQRSVDHFFESPETRFEDLILNHIPISPLRAYAINLVTQGEWPPHLADKTPTNEMAEADLKDALNEYLDGTKGKGSAGDLLATCNIDQIPEFIRTTFATIKDLIYPPTPVEGETPEEHTDDPAPT